MSTRSAIGRIDGDSFEGRYHHTDGYPTGVGAFFVERATAADDLDAFLAYIVDEHRAGWSSLFNNRCYCHWAGREEPNESEPLRDCDLFIEWAYAIDSERRTVSVWVSVRDGDSYRGQLIAAALPIDEPIDWEEIERDGRETSERAYETATTS